MDRFDVVDNESFVYATLDMARHSVHRRADIDRVGDV
jgi:hypothetical protein